MKTRLFFIAIPIIFFIFLLRTQMAFAIGVFAYVPVSDKILILDTATNQFVGTPIKLNAPISKIAITQDGKKIYVIHNNQSFISIVDVINNNSITTLSLNFNPTATDDITVTPDGKKIYLTKSDSNSIAIIDISNNTTTNLPTGAHPIKIAITPDGKRIYVLNSNYPQPGPSISVLKALDNTIVGSPIILKDSLHPEAILISPDSKKVYISTVESGDIFVIDNASDVPTVVDTIPVGFGQFTYDMVITSDGEKIYSATQDGNSRSTFYVYEIDTLSKSIVGIRISHRTDSIAITPDETKIYTTGDFAKSISVINTSTRGITSLPVENIHTRVYIPSFNIISPLEVILKIGKPFTYTINATWAQNFTVTFPPPPDYPDGLNFNSIDTITGIPTKAGVFDIKLEANNELVKVKRKLKLIITNFDPPLINSSLTADAKVGVPFTYKISALSDPLDSSPLTLKAFSLPNGLTFDGKDTISGTPMIDGVFNIQLSASNGETTTNKTLMLNIAPAGGSGCAMTNSYSFVFNLVSLLFFVAVSGFITLRIKTARD